MSDLLLKIQEAALQLNPVTLWPAGLIAAFLGIFLWLGGKRYSFYVIGIMGATFGAALGLMLSHWFTMDSVISATIGAILCALAAVMMERLVMLMLSIVIFATACGSSYLGFSVPETNWTDKLNVLETVRQGYLPETEETNPEKSNALGEHHLGVAKLREITTAIKQSASERKGMLILWTLLGAAIGLALAYLLKRLITVFCCSVVGTSAIISGSIAVILAKGDPVITSLLLKPKLTPTIFMMMVAIGIVCQLLFARKPKVIIDEDEDE